MISQAARGARAVASSSHSSTAPRAALVNVAQNALLTGSDAKRWGNAHPNLVPYQLLQDGRPADRDRGRNATPNGCACANALDLPTPRRRSVAVERTPAAFAQSRTNRLRDFSRDRGSTPAATWRALLDAAGSPERNVVQSVLDALRDTNASAVTGMPSSVGGTRSLVLAPGLDEHGDADTRTRMGVFETIRS